MKTKIYLEDSLNYLLNYIHDRIGQEFDSIESHCGEEHREFLLESFKNILYDIEHSIDHIKVDHLDEQ